MKVPQSPFMRAWMRPMRHAESLSPVEDTADRQTSAAANRQQTSSSLEGKAAQTRRDWHKGFTARGTKERKLDRWAKMASCS